MAYFVTFGTNALALGPDFPTLAAAMDEACRLIAAGETDVAVGTSDGRSISGEALIACCKGDRQIGEHLLKKG